MKVVLIAYDQAGNGRQLDLYGGDTISLNWKFTDLQTFTGTAPYSRNFRIPATDNNSGIFGYQYELAHYSTNANAANIRRKFRAYLTVEGVPIMSGYIQFKSAIITNNTIADYDVIFYGDVADLLADLKDKKLTDLIIDENVDSRIGFDQRQVANNNGFDPDFGNDWSDGRLKFALIDKGEQVTVDGSNIGNLVPCFAIKFLIDCINSEFLTDGKKLILSEEIAEHLARVYIPYANEKKGGNPIYYNVPSPYFTSKYSPNVDDYVAISSWAPLTINGQSKYIANLPALVITDDESGGLDANGLVYTFQENVTCQVWANFNLQSTGAVNTGLRVYFKITVFSTGAVIYLSAGNYDAFFMNYNNANQYVYNPIYNPATANNIVANCYAVALPTYGINGNYNGVWQFYEGDIVEVILAADYDIGAAGTTIYVANKVNDGIIGTSFYNYLFSTQPQATSSWYLFNEMAPDYLITDLINDVLKAHNAVLLPDRTNPGRVNVLTMNEYLSTGDVDDWTEFLNVDSDIVIQPTTEYQTKRQYFTYSDGNDYLNEIYKNGAFRTYGRLDLYDSSSDFTTGETKVELKARPTPNNTLVNAGPSDTINIPKFVDGSYKYKAPGPRWLYFQQLQDFVLPTVTTTVALMGNYSDQIPNLESFDLNFGNEVPLHELDATPYKTLYYRYYNRYLAELYSPESKILEASFMLGIKEIFNLEFNTSIFLFNTYWRILEVNDYVLGANRVCRVKLIRKLSSVELPSLCLLTPVQIDIDGLVRWQDINGAQQPGTKACCDEIGYIWNGTDCRRNIKDPRPSTNPLGTGYEPIKVPAGTTKPDPTTVAISSGTVLVKDDTNTTKNVIVSGDNVALLEDNRNTIAMGTDITVKSGVTDSAIFGTGLEIENRGIWYGSGDGTLANATAYGTMVDKISGNYTAVNTALYTPDFKVDSNSFYNVEIKVSMVEIDTGAIHNSLTHVGTGVIQVNAGGTIVSYSDPDNVVYESATAGTWEIGLDATGLNTIRVYVKSTGGFGYPTLPFSGTVTTVITQVRI
jgi:hypothetical protein